MIEKIQKQVLFEEAAKKGIINSQLLQIPEILSNLLGTTDIGKQRYGLPMAPFYKAKSEETIDVSKMANFFTGLARDIKVTDISITNLEDDLLLFSLEIWTRMQLLKNRANDLSKKARTERLKTSIGASWIFTESLSSTKQIDMLNSTSWFDTSEGIAFIPNSGDEKTVPMQEITVLESSLPELGNPLGSTPKLAIDGLDSTNWRCMFINDSFTSAVLGLQYPSDITAITIDPVGFGIDVKIEANSGDGYKELVRAVIYSKKTFPVAQTKVNKLRVSFRAATAALPKVAGIKEIILFQTISVLTSEIISTRLKPSEPYTELKIETKGEFPPGTNVKTYFRASTGAAWTPVTDTWHPISQTENKSLEVSILNAMPSDNGLSHKGLYGLGLDISSIPITTFEGTMEVGIDMLEISAFKKDWVEEGTFPKLLSPADFKDQDLKRTWSYVDLKAFTTEATGTCLQYSMFSTLLDDQYITRNGHYFAFERKLDSNIHIPEISTYNTLNIVPLVGDRESSQMQFGYNYRMRCMVYCPNPFSIDSRYWFYQGYRETGRRFYKDIAKSFGTFSLYINDVLIAGELYGDTVSDSREINGVTNDSDPGRPFTMNFISGWNTVDIFMNVFDPNEYGSDDFDVADSPYLQLSLYPSLFDPKFRQNNDTKITKVLASGPKKPVNEFDLLWNLPADPTFWSWDSSRDYVFFNTNQLKNIDGYFIGSPPKSVISYRSISNDSVDDLYVKVVLTRDDSSVVSPLLDSYSVSVR